MRLLFRDSVARQKIDDRLGLDFELAGQLVNTNLICFAQDFASSGCSASPSADSEASSAAASFRSEGIVVDNVCDCVWSVSDVAFSASAVASPGSVLASLTSSVASSFSGNALAALSGEPSEVSSCTCSPWATA